MHYTLVIIVAAADQTATLPPPVTIGRRAAAVDGQGPNAAAEAHSVGAYVYSNHVA